MPSCRRLSCFSSSVSRLATSASTASDYNNNNNNNNYYYYYYSYYWLQLFHEQFCQKYLYQKLPDY